MMTKSFKLMAIVLLAAWPSFAKPEVCQSLWSQHKAEYTAYVKNFQPDSLVKAQERLDKSVKSHEAWLKNLYTKIQSDTEIKLNLSDIMYNTTLLRESFDSFSKSEKAVLFSGKNNFENLSKARDKEELFEESLKQEYFGVRSSEDSSKDAVFKYISAVEDLNFTMINPAYDLLKKKIRSEKNEKVWYDENGIEMEAKVNHFRRSGEFVVSLCSRLDEEKEFPFIKHMDALPPKFACTRLNLKDNSIEKGMENREEISSPKQFQAFLTETFLENHKINPEQCLGYFMDQGQKVGLLSALMR